MATENKTGILKKREPMNDEFGEQMTWSSDNGLFYKWIIEIDGKEGSCLSKDQDPWWKPGMSIKYTIETKGNKVSFKGLKKPDPEEATSAHIKEVYKDKPSAYNDPVQCHRLATTEAISCMILLLKELSYNPPTIDAITQNIGYLYSWMIKDFKDKDYLWNRISCLKSAIYCINAGREIDADKKVTKQGWMTTFYPDTAEKMTAKVLKLAEEFVKLPNAITKSSLGLEEK